MSVCDLRLERNRERHYQGNDTNAIQGETQSLTITVRSLTLLSAVSVVLELLVLLIIELEVLNAYFVLEREYCWCLPVSVLMHQRCLLCCKTSSSAIAERPRCMVG